MESKQLSGSFYLGKIVDPKNGKSTTTPFLYNSKDLTTHAVCLGMTGSGKTGLGVALLEEAALNHLPAIIIDPKGDLGNLMLAFPTLSAKDFLSWVDPSEAQRKGQEVKAYAETIAKTWKEGLAEWDEGPEDVQKFINSVERVIYTPASTSGIPLSILNTFEAPTEKEREDTAAIIDRVTTITSGLLGLLGIQADPLKSREHILISTIISKAWEKGINLDVATIIHEIQTPSFVKIGVLDIDTFYPAKERLSLSIQLNNLLASPGFEAWMKGDPLNIDQLLYNPQGKPKLSIISIAHLSDAERMFFVTLLLNQILTWMRRQSGTSSLRAILYMDEIYGFFPPVSMPPSKVPMITLLKQARAFGLGVVLATQNPVDLDYKGLANCGTWFIGKLQTERDRSRVMEGLAQASNEAIDNKNLERMLALVGSRLFIMRSIYQKEPILFQTRWTLSYLRGPLTLSQIEKLTVRDKEEDKQKNRIESEPAGKPFVPAGISECFLQTDEKRAPVHYQPRMLGLAKLHFVDSKNKIDVWKEICLIAPFKEEGQAVGWEEAENDPEAKKKLTHAPEDNGTYDELPAGFGRKKNLSAYEKELATFLYQNHVLTIYRSNDLNLNSKEGESKEDFSTNVKAALREKSEAMIAEIERKYSEKIAVLTERARRAEEKAAIQKKQWWLQIVETALSFVTTIMGALLGKGVTKGTITQTGTSMRKAGRIAKENQEASQAEENFNAIQAQIEDIKYKMQAEINKVQENVENIRLESIEIRPRKSDISIEKVALVWCSITQKEY